MEDHHDNINYDLITLLHTKMKTRWRLDKHYCEDADEAKCHSKDALKQIHEDEKKHIEMLKKELKMRMESDVF